MGTPPVSRAHAPELGDIGPKSDRIATKTSPVDCSRTANKTTGRKANKKVRKCALGLAIALPVALGIAGTLGAKALWKHDANLATTQRVQDEEAQAPEPDELGAPESPDWCRVSEPNAEHKDSEKTAELAIVAKIIVEEKGRDAAKPQKPSEVIDKAKSRAAFIVKHCQTKSEEELRKDLAWIKEIGLGSSAQSVLGNWRKWITGSLGTVTAQDAKFINLKHATPIYTARPDLGGLPFRQGSSCQISPKEAKTLAALGPKLKTYLNAVAPLDAAGHRPSDLTLLRETLRREMHGKRPEWLRYEAIPAMMQILMHEEKPLRTILVDMLAEIPEKQATVALAQRAVFDLSPEIRETALVALKTRKPDDYLPTFWKALQYPIPAFSDHAAEALVALNAQSDESISHMVVMLSEPDPLNPVVSHSRGGFQREVVRVNHVTNCLLCHAPSITGSDDGVIGVDPILTTRGPGTTVGSPSRGGWGGGSTTIAGPSQSLLVRADIAFIRQDFSVSQPELRAGTTIPVPTRFDYMVRTRWMTEKKAKDLQKKYEDKDTYPQREAVLFALRELTHQDAGPTSEAWRKLFPRAELDIEAAKYRDQLVGASPKKRESALSMLKDGEGVVYTLALADAIPKLPKEFQEKGRQALAERLSRMTPQTLRDKLNDEDVEIRKAAIAAAILKEDKSLLSDLSELLEDPNPAIAGLADEAIKALSKSHEKQKADQTTEVSASKNQSQGGDKDLNSLPQGN
jgi:HEAT repeat protein